MKKSDCPFKLPLHIPEHVTGTGHVYLDDADGKRFALVSQGAAAFIVRACNSHEAMLEALKTMCLPHQKGWKVTDWELRLAQARAAIAQAEQE